MKLKQIISHWKTILYGLHILYFNFKYLPFRQALKIPILLYKPHFMGLSGKINIEGPISFGMISLGFNHVPILRIPD